MEATDVAAMTFPPTTEFVSGWLVPGLTLLVGKPKKGKSWLVLGWLMSIASGELAMGALKTRRVDCLYIALEDSMRRLQSRMSVIGKAPPGLRFATQWPRGERGVRALSRWLDLHPETRVVAIDVLGKFKGTANGGSAYDADYSTLEGLQSLAHKRDVAIIVVHHMRKADSEDMIDLASGTLGLTGAADHIVALRPADRLGGDEGLEFIGDIEITGRDLASQRADLAFEGGRWLWRGAWSGDDKNDRDRQILDLHAEKKTQREIADAMKCSVGTVNSVLRRGRKAA